MLEVVFRISISLRLGQVSKLAEAVDVTLAKQSVGVRNAFFGQG